jgi:phosphatidylinositol glycan class T
LYPTRFDLPHLPTVQHYGIFPKSLAEVVAHYHVQELHLTLTQGQWRTRVWGYPAHPAPPGAELWAWFLPEADSEKEWPGLVDAMSGLLGAHLNAIDSASSFQPLVSFRPNGAILSKDMSNSSALLRYAALPRETVCTENFTPWTKLLPCGTAAGLGELFEAGRLYDSDYHSLGLHFTPHCLDDGCGQVGVRLSLTLTVVFPPPVTSNPSILEWSLKSLFHRPLTSACPLAFSSTVTVETNSIDGVQVSLSQTPSLTETVEVAGRRRDRAVFDLHSITNSTSSKTLTSLSVSSSSWAYHIMPEPPELLVSRHLVGSGHDWGGLATEITNSAPHTVEVLYLEMVPWFFRLYLHTLSVSQAAVLSQHYIPAKDRRRAHMLELRLSLPPLSTSYLSLQFRRAHLKWTEHKPDAHHGFYINSAVITTVLSECPNCTSLAAQDQDLAVLRLYSEPLLVSLPTPDFSMPYNVICFVCTVIAIAFGSVFNLTTRTLRPAAVAKEKLLTRILRRIGVLSKQKSD